MYYKIFILFLAIDLSISSVLRKNPQEWKARIGNLNIRISLSKFNKAQANKPLAEPTYSKYSYDTKGDPKPQPDQNAPFSVTEPTHPSPLTTLGLKPTPAGDAKPRPEPEVDSEYSPEHTNILEDNSCAKSTPAPVLVSEPTHSTPFTTREPTPAPAGNAKPRPEPEVDAEYPLEHANLFKETYDKSTPEPISVTEPEPTHPAPLTTLESTPAPAGDAKPKPEVDAEYPPELAEPANLLEETSDDKSTPALSADAKLIVESTPAPTTVGSTSMHTAVTKPSPEFDYKGFMHMIAKLRLKHFDEYENLGKLLKPSHLDRKIYLKEFISIIIEIFYRTSPPSAKEKFDLLHVKTDKYLREDYHNLIQLIEGEFTDYIVPVNFIETIIMKNFSHFFGVNLLRSDDNMSEYIRKFYCSAMESPAMLSEQLGYSLENFTNFIEYLILNPEFRYKDNGRVIRSYIELFNKFSKIINDDERAGTFPKKSWSVLIKTVLRDTPKDLRIKFFDNSWKSEYSLKVLDLLKNLNYDFNIFTLKKKLDKNNEIFMKEFSICPRCQRIVVESFLKFIENFLKAVFQEE